MGQHNNQDDHGDDYNNPDYEKDNNQFRETDSEHVDTTLSS